MKKTVFLKNALVLTGCSLLLSGIGMLFRVYQTSLIGAEGMGLMQLLLSVYYFATNLAVSGLNLAVTRLISESGQSGAAPALILRQCFGLCGLAGLISAGALFTMAPMVGKFLLGDVRTIPALQILALGLPFLSISSCCRGYFLAVRNSLKPCLGQIGEQLCCFAVTALLLPIMVPRGLAAACSAIAIGMTAGEILGNLIVVFFLWTDRRGTPPPLTSERIPLSRIFSISLPVALGYYLRSALIAVENLLIPAGLKQCGRSYTESLAAYGLVKGIALPTIQFPSAFLISFSQLLIPEIAQSRSDGQTGEISTLARRVFRICLRFSVPVVACFWCFGDVIGAALYGNKEIGNTLRILCPLIPFMYLDSIVDAMLKGLDEQMYSLKVNMSDSCIRIFLMILLLPRLGIQGYILALYCSILYNASLSIGRVIWKSRLRLDVYGWLLVPGLCAVLTCLFCRSALEPLFPEWGLLFCILLIVTASGGYVLLIKLADSVLPQVRRKTHSRRRTIAKNH